MIITGPGDGKATANCTVVARMAGLKQVGTLAESLSTAYGSRPIRRKTQDLVWLRGQLAVQLTASGSQDSPAVRISTLFLRQAAK